MFCGEDTLFEYLHNSFVMSFARMTGIDLSDLPLGESLHNNPIERLMNQALLNEEPSFQPPSRAEYRPPKFIYNTKVNYLIKSVKKSRKLEYFTWNTLR